MTWYRAGARRPGPDPRSAPQPGLTIEFPDDDEPAGGGGGASFETELLDSDVGAEPWPPARWLMQFRQRTVAYVSTHRRAALAISCVVVLIVAAGAIAWQVGQAQQRGRDRFTLTATSAAYIRTTTFSGLSLSLTLLDRGPAPVSVSALALIQPGLSVTYAKAPIPLKVGEPTTITMPAVYKCSPWFGPAAQTVTMYATDVHGTISLLSLTIPQQTGPNPSNGWLALRYELCDTPMGIQH